MPLVILTDARTVDTLPKAAAGTISTAAFVAAAALFLTQHPADPEGVETGDNVFTVPFQPIDGSITFGVSGPAPSDYFFTIGVFQTNDCWAARAATDASTLTPECTWSPLVTDLYARYDSLAGTASTSGLQSDQWGGIYVLYLSPKTDAQVPSTTTIADPSTTSQISGQVGSAQWGGSFSYTASIIGAPGAVTARATFFPGDLTPVNVSLLSMGAIGATGSRRRLLAAPPGTTSTDVIASGLLLYNSEGNATFTPQGGALVFNDVSDTWVDQFYAVAYQYSGCAPTEIDKPTAYVNCTWKLLQTNIGLGYIQSTQAMLLGNLGGVWNSLYVLLSDSTVPGRPPTAPSPQVAAGSVSGGQQTALIVLTSISGAGLVVGLPAFVIIKGRLKRAR